MHKLTYGINSLLYFTLYFKNLKNIFQNKNPFYTNWFLYYFFIKFGLWFSHLFFLSNNTFVLLLSVAAFFREVSPMRMLYIEDTSAHTMGMYMMNTRQ